MTSRTLLSCLASAALTLAAAPGALSETVLVHWAGNYYTNDREADLNILDLTPETLKVPLANGALLLYSETTPKSPPLPFYSGTSATFYGVAQLTSDNRSAKGKMQMRIQRYDGANRIHLNTLSASTAEPANLQGLLFWKREDFPGGFANRTNLTLGDLSQFALTIPKIFSKTTAIRFAVQNGGVWYLSEAVLTGSYFGTAPEPFVVDDPATGFWAAWNPEGTPLEPPPPLFEVEGASLTDITAVGVYFNVTYQASNSAILDFDSFKATAK